MDIVTRHKINILIQLARADKDFAGEERQKIYEIAREQNFSEEAVTQLIDEPEPIGTLGALSENQKVDYLLKAIELMYADHKILASEVTFTKNIAVKLGFKTPVVDYLVENYPKTVVEELKNHVLRDYTLT